MKAKTVKEVLVAAKWLLTHYDWCQGAWYQSTEGKGYVHLERFVSGETKLQCMCLSGALNAVDVNTSLKGQARELLLATMDTGTSIISWNDTNGRTKKQVIALLNKAIKKAQS